MTTFDRLIHAFQNGQGELAPVGELHAEGETGERMVAGFYSDDVDHEHWGTATGILALLQRATGVVGTRLFVGEEVDDVACYSTFLVGNNHGADRWAVLAECAFRRQGDSEVEVEILEGDRVGHALERVQRQQIQAAASDIAERANKAVKTDVHAARMLLEELMRHPDSAWLVEVWKTQMQASLLQAATPIEAAGTPSRGPRL